MSGKVNHPAYYGLSRTRDKKGEIIKQTTLPWVNCIHTNVGGGWKTMEVLILEVYEENRIIQHKETAERVWSPDQEGV